MLDYTKTSLVLSYIVGTVVLWTQLSLTFRNLDHKVKERDEEKWKISKISSSLFSARKCTIDTKMCSCLAGEEMTSPECHLIPTFIVLNVQNLTL